MSEELIVGEGPVRERLCWRDSAEYHWELRDSRFGWGSFAVNVVLHLVFVPLFTWLPVFLVLSVVSFVSPVVSLILGTAGVLAVGVLGIDYSKGRGRQTLGTRTRTRLVRQWIASLAVGFSAFLVSATRAQFSEPDAGTWGWFGYLSDIFLRAVTFDVVQILGWKISDIEPVTGAGEAVAACLKILISASLLAIVTDQYRASRGLSFAGTVQDCFWICWNHHHGNGVVVARCGVVSTTRPEVVLDASSVVKAFRTDQREQNFRQSP